MAQLDVIKARVDLAQAENNLRLSLLIEQRQKQQAEVEKTLAAERQRTAALARQAANLQELIAKIEQGLDESRRAAAASTRPKR